MDSENKDQLLKLMRYHSNFQENPQNLVGLDDYVKKMKTLVKKEGAGKTADYVVAKYIQ
jgi:HSP90 family molecular chaperone